MENDGTFAPQTGRAVLTRLAVDPVLSGKDVGSLFGEKHSHSFLCFF